MPDAMGRRVEGDAPPQQRLGRLGIARPRRRDPYRPDPHRSRAERERARIHVRVQLHVHVHADRVAGAFERVHEQPARRQHVAVAAILDRQQALGHHDEVGFRRGSRPQPEGLGVVGARRTAREIRRVMALRQPAPQEHPRLRRDPGHDPELFQAACGFAHGRREPDAQAVDMLAIGAIHQHGEQQIG